MSCHANQQPLAFNRVNRAYSRFANCDHCRRPLHLPNGRELHGLIANQEGWFCGRRCYIRHAAKAEQCSNLRAGIYWALFTALVFGIAVFTMRGV